jgi:hypothetical protein
VAGAILAAYAVGATVLLAALARGWIGRRLLAKLAVVLLFAELFATGSGLDWINWDPAANLRPPATAFLKTDPGLYRIEVRPEVWGWWSPSAALVGGVDDVTGVYNPLQLADTQLYWERLTDRATPRYDFLNAKYVVATKDFALPWDRFTPVYDQDSNVNIYLNLRSLPRAIFVTRAAVATDHDDAWRRVQDPSFDPASEVVVEGGRAADAKTAEPARVDITGYRTNSLDITVATSTEGYLVVSDAFYPGWTAYADGASLEVVRANFAFKAVYLPPGEHHVRLAFAPRSVWIGLALTAFAAVVLTGIAAFAMGAPSRWGRRAV